VKTLSEQFGHPRGVLGWVVGHVMASKNVARSRWALTLLAPEPGEAVLEIGYGSGADIRRLLSAVGERGRVAGVDPSREMRRQARARNRAAVASGSAWLELGSAHALPFADAAFDAVFSINSAQFWPDLEHGASEVARVLAPTGRALLVVQPMWRGAGAADTEQWRERLCRAVTRSGLAVERTERAEFRPAPAAAVAVLARRR